MLVPVHPASGEGTGSPSLYSWRATVSAESLLYRRRREASETPACAVGHGNARQKFRHVAEYGARAVGRNVSSAEIPAYR